jgi:hypothetical protein
MPVRPSLPDPCQRHLTQAPQFTSNISAIYGKNGPYASIPVNF